MLTDEYAFVTMSFQKLSDVILKQNKKPYKNVEKHLFCFMKVSVYSIHYGPDHTATNGAFLEQSEIDCS